MRAKRSKKYRKLMHQYELAFGFREPYQVLVDANFLHAVHTFKMELIPALERTLQGKVKPLLTKCSLAAIMAAQPINPKTNNPYRPFHLPPPTELPLRHCSHNADSTPIEETECLLSLLCPSTEAKKKNKEHYILATADPPAPKKDAAAGGDAGRKRKRGGGVDEAAVALRSAQKFRSAARSIPGVPIVYVKRSVMILEPMSAPSDGIREGYEKGKFRVGLNDEAMQKKRGGAGEGDKDKSKSKGVKKPKQPNPLSVKKPKKKTPGDSAGRKEGGSGEKAAAVPDEGDGEGEGAPKKRRRRHHKSANQDGAGPGESAAAGGDAMEE
ncbi:hypothetical protein BDW42DRAFT_152347 [Aspergillus taichungensis]|uniref:UTP23 sensor motif region domain-containing protein n=1 Tax=Aspergillus taichungensis TaxID=482145 RepID=A0A2J5HLA4_9EURO|nr:hypothetical protein BDW42DRAFT_152347 [Aspergillus taichungensis]